MSELRVRPGVDGEVLRMRENTGTPPTPKTGWWDFYPDAAGWHSLDDTGENRQFQMFGDFPMGRVVVVDDMYGNDARGARQVRAFKTVGAAVAAALPGDTIWILPGKYELTGPLTVPANVAIRGLNVSAVEIALTNVTADTTLITMGEGSRVEDVALKLTSVEHHTLIGVLFPGTTSATAKLRTAVVTVDNSTAPLAGSSNVYGILSNGTGAPGRETSAIRATTVTVNSIGGGTKRSILVNSNAHSFNVRDANTRCKSAGGSGSFIASEVNVAGATLGYDSGTCQGDSSDVSQTLGTMELGVNILVNKNANGKSFTATSYTSVLAFADNGTMPGASTRYMRPGTGPVSIAEVKLRMSRSVIVKELTVRAVSGPGAARTDTFTLRRNGVDTSLTASLTGAQTQATNSSDSVHFNTNDDLSLKVVTAAGTATQDVTLTIEIY